ncbi:cell division protein FtsA [Gracilibacillus ureilyticus]|uniref:Cell division protein FtsA n=1 Tax=Gracilibacillus ureilyticus TaxID=531814 RepID=A0A1H9TD63_9BACI|nr:pilus assembly protein PilM [Gracilibacillus ureilyticus]SER94967.1 cell division protein FtsA [Gracilibacillus ureilyticus]
MSEQMFALDIGTRSVVGLLLDKEEKKYKVIDYYVVEHEERSMLDGQIHDVVSVSKVIERVKLHLEQKHDITLERVCVAAAGRALKTKRIQTSKNIEKQPLMNEEDILYLELEAVQKAQYNLAQEENTEKSSHYYCVGYSVLNYTLDGEVIGSLIDQQGIEANAEIIATFLPKIVVESLLSALNRAGLQLEALTLEPIAAIHVLIPPSMRRLNVALVDIGAGTSDIAITSEGTVTAYGMVPKAGDEITEAISDHYLLDFNLAEKFKKEITLNKTAMVEDILGFEQEVTYEELVEAVLPSVDNLASAIAEEIMLLNGKTPKAVMLVGGGSQTPELAKRLAVKLKLPVNRVAIRGVEAIQLLQPNTDMPVGPEFITPIGIAIAAKQNPVHYISVTVNDRLVRLFEMKQLTIADALLAAGVNIQKLYGRPGMAYIVTYNGKDVTIPGSFGKTPAILINGEKATVDSSIQNGDTLEVLRGDDGKSPEMTVGEFIGAIKEMTIYIEGEPYTIQQVITVNGKQVDPGYVLKDGDKINYDHRIKISELSQFDKMDQTFTVWIDDQKISMNEYSKRIVANGKDVSSQYLLKDGDRLEIINETKPKVQDLSEKLQMSFDTSIDIIYNGKPLKISKPLVQIFRNGEKLEQDETINDQDKLQIKKLKNEPFIFQDIFRFISLDLSKVKGKVTMLKNSEPVSFFDQLKPGDKVTISIES